MSEPFETVAQAGIVLEGWDGVPDLPEELLEQWLVFDVLFGEPICTWDETNLGALCDQMVKRHGDGCAALLRSEDGCAWSLIFNPEKSELVRQAEFARDAMRRGEHIDKAYFDEVIAERCGDIWEEFDMADRIDCAALLDPDQITLALAEQCPVELHGLLCERYEL